MFFQGLARIRATQLISISFFILLSLYTDMRIAVVILFSFLSLLNTKSIGQISKNTESYVQDSTEKRDEVLYVQKQDSLRNMFLADDKLHPTVKYYIQDTGASVLLYELTDSMEFKVLGDINSDGKIDSVFLLPELFDGDLGQSFTFTDIRLSKIQTGVQCNHLANLFVIDDIDEDGIKEIGLYYSSCASRFKMLRVYTFESGQWNEAGSVVFDLNYTKPSMQKRIKKIGKGKFAMREITDAGAPDSIVIQDKWLNFEIK